jgi:hypothetical protein
VSVFYTGDTDDITVQLGTFFNAVKSYFPNAVTWSIPAAGDKLESADGGLAGVWTGGTAAVIAGTGGTGSYVAGTGMYVRWLTGAVVGRHKLQGRTFLAPLMAAQFDVGSIADLTVTAVQAAATTLVASNKLTLWHRPSSKGAADGTFRLVIGAVVPDKVTSLRTRRS